MLSTNGHSEENCSTASKTEVWKYWPGKPMEAGIQALLGEFRNIAQCVCSWFGDIRLPLPLRSVALAT